jgi:acetyl-CoA carboxylase biotin carboxyl carrier protein
MAEKTLIANVRADEDGSGTLLVASPVVGRANNAPRAGVFLNPFDPVLTIEILNRRFTLRLPRDVQGRVVQTFLPRALTSVAYNDPLVRLDPHALEHGIVSAEAAPGTGSSATEAAAEGMIVVSAPSEGIFYRRPTPESEPYVEEGSKVTSGSVLGLVEVMKCFNQIAYGGPGYPERGEIARIFVDDNAEVRFGQALFWVKPLA